MPDHSDNTPQIFDYHRIEEMLENDTETINEILSSFLDNLDENVQQIGATLDENDNDKTRAAVHLLAGACENIGGEELGALLRGMEKDLKKGQSINRDDVDIVSQRAEALALSIKGYLSKAAG